MNPAPDAAAPAAPSPETMVDAIAALAQPADETAASVEA